MLLSIESGANDGLAFALVALAVALAGGSGLLAGAGRSAVELAVAVAVGLAVGLVVGRLLTVSDQRRDIEHSAFLTIGLAALVAGLAYNHEISRSERKEEWEVQEAVNRFLVLPVFVLLGAALPWSAWAALPPLALAFAVVVLLLRRAPVVLAGSGPLGLTPTEGAFVGWFGPIGVAALFYLADGRVTGQVGDGLWAVGTLVIALSTLAHGLTGTPGRQLYVRRTRPTASG